MGLDGHGTADLITLGEPMPLIDAAQQAVLAWRYAGHLVLWKANLR